MFFEALTWTALRTHAHKQRSSTPVPGSNGASFTNPQHLCELPLVRQGFHVLLLLAVPHVLMASLFLTALPPRREIVGRPLYMYFVL